MAVSTQPLAVTSDFELDLPPHGPDELRVLEFEASEELSRLPSLVVTAAPAEGVSLDAAALLGAPASFVIHHAGGERVVHGIATDVSTWDVGGRDGPRVRLTLAPGAWRLSQGRRSRIFQGQSVPEIARLVLSAGGVAHEERLSGAYAPREYCTQYEESDLAFVARLLEEEGIFWFFEHAGTGETLILADDSPRCARLDGDATLPFREPSGLAPPGESVAQFSARLAIRPGTVTLRDHAWRTPAVDLTASARATRDEAYEVYDHPGRYEDAAAGRRLARLHLEAHRVGAETMAGRSDCRRLQAGRAFELAEHPLGGLDGEYLVVSVRHRGTQPLPRAPTPAPRTYVNDFRCVPIAVPFRAERSTPRPFIPGPQTAIVTGPASEEIHTDPHGRITVQFHWDREGRRDEHSSCWIRVAQAWAGPGWGALYLPRVGHEVVVEFLDGDPDRPLVTGSVYNGANPPPLELPGDKTRSTLRSASTPGGQGSNELRFEDAAGSEEVYLHAQSRLDVAVEDDKTQRVGGDERLTVAGDRTREIHGSQFLTVKGDDAATVLKDQTLAVAGNRTTTVGGSHFETIARDQQVSVAGAQTVTVAAAAVETVGAAKALTVGGAYAVTVGAAMNEAVGAAKAEEVGGAKVEAVGGDKSELVGGARSLSVGGDLSETVGGGRTLRVGKGLVVNVAAELKQTAKEGYTLTARTLTLSAEEELAIDVGAAKLTFKKDGAVRVEGKEFKVKASGNVVLKGSKIVEN